MPIPSPQDTVHVLPEEHPTAPPPPGLPFPPACTLLLPSPPTHRALVEVGAELLPIQRCRGDDDLEGELGLAPEMEGEEGGEGGERGGCG